jgi:S-disulfanyl-L-cysteine oxidoreductase SoxD
MFTSRFHLCFYLAVFAFSCTTKTEPDDHVTNETIEMPESFQFGRTASQREIDSLDIDVSADGTGLPQGSGTVDKGRRIYAVKCAACHGKTGKEGPQGKLVADRIWIDSLPASEKTIGNYWPYATTLYDYINRAMPYNAPGTLTVNEVYSLTAFLLYQNEIVDSTFVVNASNLSQLEMPGRKLFVEDDRHGGAEIR